MTTLQGEPVRITTNDGVTLAASFHSASGAPRGAVLLMPAIASPARSLKHLAMGLSNAGFHVLRGDYRFTSESTPGADRAHDAGMLTILDRDVPAFLDELNRRAPGLPVACGGHSLGGQLSVLAMGRFTGRVQAAFLVAVSMPFDVLWPWPARVGPALAFRLFPWMGRVAGRLPPRPWGMGEAVPRTLINDWGHWGRTGRYESEGVDLALVLAGAAGPVLTICSSDDTLYAPEPALRHYEAMLTAARVSATRVTPTEMGAHQLGHFGLVRPPAAEQVAARIAAFLGRELPSTA